MFEISVLVLVCGLIKFAFLALFESSRASSLNSKQQHGTVRPKQCMLLSFGKMSQNHRIQIDNT